MPALKRKVIRRNDNLIIEERDETTKTEAVSVIPLRAYIICDKCGKGLTLSNQDPTTIECSSCGCPTFHTSTEFTIQCANCDNLVNVKDKLNGHCAKCKQRMWKTV